MPIKIPDALPARSVLEGENVFVMGETRAKLQDIRPMRLVILNLMPLKITTETHILRMLSNTPLQVEVEFLHMSTHKSKNTSQEHLASFYKTFEEIAQQKYDGMIVTGAPVEKLDYGQVNYWDELKTVLEWSKHNVTNTFHICWGAQAGLYYHYGVDKQMLNEKLFGVFEHATCDRHEPLLRGFDDVFLAPHSRYTEVRREDIEKIPELVILSESKEAGVYVVMSTDRRQIFVTGHSEYDPFTLRDEYLRDKKKGIDTAVPINYFPEDDPDKAPIVTWRSHASLLFSNWLNYYVYQETPFLLEEIT